MRLAAWLGVVATAIAGAAWAQAPAKQPVRIGLVLASGPISQEIANGMALALDEAGPVIGGRPVVVVREDSSGKPEMAVDRARKLVDQDRVDMLVGPVTSPEALAMRDFAEERHVPLIVPEAPGNALTGAKCSRFVVRVSYANEQIATALAGYLAAGRKLRRVYMLAADDPLGHDMLDSFRRAFEAAGGEVVGETYVPRNAPDYAPYLMKVRLTGAEVAFAHFTGTAAERFTTAYHELGLHANLKLAGTSWLVSPFHRTDFRLETIAGTIGATNYMPDADSGTERDFVRRFAARFGHLPSEHAAHGYDAGRLIAETLRAEHGHTSDAVRFADALARTPFEGARGLTHIDPATHNVVQDILVVKNSAHGGAGAITGAPLARVPAVAAAAENCKLPRS